VPKSIARSFENLANTGLHPLTSLKKQARREV
jgi:hypothetical protein